MPQDQSPRTAAEWFEKGRKCFHEPDGPGAINALERAIDLDPAYRHPDGDNPYFYLGKIHEVEGRLESAIMFYTQALAVDRFDEESLIGRGSCYTVTRQHQLAIDDFMRLLQATDQQRRVPRKDLLYAIAENYRQMQDWGKAVFWGRQAVDADPENERHRELLAEATAKNKI
ncbi:MAG: tetratricopeptide repeat protein [Desulfobacterales bacterium]